MRLEKNNHNVKYQSLPISLGNFASQEFQNLSLSGENCRHKQDYELEVRQTYIQIFSVKITSHCSIKKIFKPPKP